jgi:hypothetical protein
MEPHKHFSPADIKGLLAFAEARQEPYYGQPYHGREVNCRTLWGCLDPRIAAIMETLEKRMCAVALDVHTTKLKIQIVGGLVIFENGHPVLTDKTDTYSLTDRRKSVTVQLGYHVCDAIITRLDSRCEELLSKMPYGAKERVVQARARFEERLIHEGYRFNGR